MSNVLKELKYFPIVLVVLWLISESVIGVQAQVGMEDSSPIATPTATATAIAPTATPSPTSTPTATPVVLYADLSVVGTDSPDPVIAGEILTYDFTITNNGPSDTSFVYFYLEQWWSEDEPFISAVASQGSCTTQPVLCDLGDVANADKVTVSFQVQIDPAWSGSIFGAFRVVALGVEADPDFVNNGTGRIYTTVIQPPTATPTPTATPEHPGKGKGKNPDKGKGKSK